MHIYFGERMLKGYCFPFLVRNCISYERIQYINDIYKIQYTLLSSIWFVKIVKISTNLKEESKEREGGKEGGGNRAKNRVPNTNTPTERFPEKMTVCLKSDRGEGGGRDR